MPRLALHKEEVMPSVDENAMTLGEFLTHTLDEAGLTTWQLWKLTGYSPRYYDQVAEGTANIDAPGHYGKLVPILGRTVATWRGKDEAWVSPRL